MPVSSILLATTKDDKSTDLIKLLEDLIPETRMFPGCIDMKILRNEEKPNDFVFSGVWKSASDYQKYLEYRTNQGVIDKLGNLLSSPPEIKILCNTNI